MYVLLVYDVEVGRVAKVHKLLKRYLHWVQNSVFEGELTDAQIADLKSRLEAITERSADSILIYTARDQKWLAKEVVGRERASTSNLI
jgi:CRISPR-associated protein Cas2